MPQKSADHQMTIEMAKEICMIQRTDIGKKCRQYFIEVEKQWKNQSNNSKKAELLLQIYSGGQSSIIAARELTELEVSKATTPLLENIAQQQELIKIKDKKLEQLKPFVQFAIKLQNTNDTVSMEQAAKMLKEDGIEIGRNTLFKILREHKVLMENNSPYQKYIDLDLFEIKAVIKEDKYNKERIYPVTRVTGKGLIFINKKLREWFGI